MSLLRPAAGRESCLQDSFLLYRIRVSKALPDSGAWGWHKRILCRKTCFAVVRSIPMSLLRQKICRYEAHGARSG